MRTIFCELPSFGRCRESFSRQFVNLLFGAFIHPNKSGEPRPFPAASPDWPVTGRKR